MTLWLHFESTEIWVSIRILDHRTVKSAQSIVSSLTIHTVHEIVAEPDICIHNDCRNWASPMISGLRSVERVLVLSVYRLIFLLADGVRRGCHCVLWALPGGPGEVFVFVLLCLPVGAGEDLRVHEVREVVAQPLAQVLPSLSF